MIVLRYTYDKEKMCVGAWGKSKRDTFFKVNLLLFSPLMLSPVMYFIIVNS